MELLAQGRRRSCRPEVRTKVDVATFMPFEPSESAKSISLSKYPMFRKIGLFIIFFMWTKVMMLKLHVEEAKMSVSMVATWSHPARLQGATGSDSPVNTRAPESRREQAREQAWCVSCQTRVRHVPSGWYEQQAVGVESHPSRETATGHVPRCTMFLIQIVECGESDGLCRAGKASCITELFVYHLIFSRVLGLARSVANDKADILAARPGVLKETVAGTMLLRKATEALLSL